jgi:hypothetical protein
MMAIVMVISSITFQNSTIEMRTEWTTMNQWGTRDVVIDEEHIKERLIKPSTQQVIGIESENLEPEMEEWTTKPNYQQYDNDRDIGFEFGQEHWDRPHNKGRNGNGNVNVRNQTRTRTSPRSPTYLQYAQDDMAMTYFMGEHGRDYLQVSDFQLLGFLNPKASHQVIFPLHSKFMRNYETTSPYGYKRGPDVKSLMACTTLKALDDTEQEAVIEWYEYTSQQLEAYGIQLTPFDEIELMYGPYAFCIPGIGVEKYHEIGHILAQVLTTTLLPMKTNATDSELSQLLAIEAAKSRTNGFDLLDVVMKHCVKAFDANEVEIEGPKYSQMNNVFKFSERMLVTAKLAAKRGQVYSAGANCSNDIFEQH